MTLDFAFEVNNPLPFLAAAVLNNRIIPDTRTCELVGWNAPPGNTVLQVIQQPVMNRQMCNSQLSNPIIQGQVSERHICVGVATLNPVACNVRGASYHPNPPAFT